MNSLLLRPTYEASALVTIGGPRAPAVRDIVAPVPGCDLRR